MMNIRKKQIKIWEDMLKLETQIFCKFLPIEFHRLEQFIVPMSFVLIQKGSQAIEFKNRQSKLIQTIKREWLDMYIHIYEIQLQQYEQQFENIHQQLELSVSIMNTTTMIADHVPMVNKIKEYVMTQTNRLKQEVYDRMSIFRITLLRNRQRSSIGKDTIGVSPEPYLDLISNPFDKREWTQLSLGRKDCCCFLALRS